MDRTWTFVSAVCGLALTLPFQVTADELDELDARCEAARQELIEPLRAEEIEKCVEKGKTPETCERLMRGYGEGAYLGDGGFRARMFNDIPECQAALEARQSTTRRRR